MTLRAVLGMALAGLLLTAGPDVSRATEEQGELVLFNGKDLDNWIVEGPDKYKDGDEQKPIWVVEEGLLHCRVPSSSYGFLRYGKQEFADFRLHFEYRFAPKATAKSAQPNSGVGIRTVPFDPKTSDKTRPSFAAYEVQLLDDAGAKPDKHGTASLYNYVAPTENTAKPAGEWNVMEIECVGPHITIVLNGKTVLDVDQSTIAEIKNKPLKGYVCLQNHGSRIDFRNIRVAEIKKQ